MLVIFVSRIGHGVEEQLEARKAADIRWRAASLADDESGVLLAENAGSDIFDGYGVTPVITHVVGVDQMTNAAVDEGTEPHVLRCGEVAFDFRLSVQRGE